MRVLPLLSATAGALTASAASAGAIDINGWYSCSESVYGLSDVPFECAEVRVPMCWDGICSSDKTIDLFVRRWLVPSDVRTEDTKTLWMLQGGPGGSSTVMDSYLAAMNVTASGLFDLYTMDHRGTGRSFFLKCDAAQAYSEKSPWGTSIAPNEIPDCFSDLSYQIDGHFEAFSVTSAAMDVKYLVENLNCDDAEVFIYGVSYGTLLTERVMHLAPANVRGYILDGIIAEDESLFSSNNANRLHPSERFAQDCEADALCSSYFEDELTEYEGLTDAWLALYDELDSAVAGENACADLLNENTVASKPSYYLRYIFESIYIKDATMRTLIPAILYRLGVCDDIDIPFLRTALNLPEASASSAGATRRLEAYDEVEEMSMLLHYIIKMSELWSNPPPSWDEQFALYKSGVFTIDMTNECSWYCYMTSNYSTPACSFLLDGTSGTDFEALDAVGPFTYEPDEYYHKFAVIPEDVSVLMFNGGLDFQTYSEGGEREYENLQGGDKMLVTFEYGVHGTGVAPTTPTDVTGCGKLIIAQFVYVGGDLSAINTTCLATMPAMSFNDSVAIEAKFPGLTDLYDGEMPSATSVSSARHRRRRLDDHEV